MKYVQAPALTEIRLTHAVGEPMWDGVESDGRQKPATQTYRQFLLIRTTDEAFAEYGGEKKGVDLIELLQSARAQINAACDSAAPLHGFEDEIFKRLQRSILHPKQGRIGPLHLEHNWIDWVLPWKHPHDKPPAALEPAEDTSEAVDAALEAAHRLAKLPTHQEKAQ